MSNRDRRNPMPPADRTPSIKHFHYRDKDHVSQNFVGARKSPLGGVADGQMDAILRRLKNRHFPCRERVRQKRARLSATSFSERAFTPPQLTPSKS
jgi:hypothetical protein